MYQIHAFQSFVITFENVGHLSHYLVGANDGEVKQSANIPVKFTSAKSW